MLGMYFVIKQIIKFELLRIKLCDVKEKIYICEINTVK